MSNPKILYDNRLSDATPTASSTASGYSVLNLRDWRPYTWWAPASLPATVTVDCGVAREADYALLYGHDLHSKNLFAEIQGSADGSAWTTLSSTNLAPHRAEDASQSLVGATVAANVATSPRGALVADKVIENTATSSHYLVLVPTGYSAAKASVYYELKAAGRYRAAINIGSDTINRCAIEANLNTGSITVTNGGGSITSLGNGWYGIHGYSTLDIPTDSYSVLYLLDAAGNDVYTGNGTDGVLVGYRHFRLGVEKPHRELENKGILLQFARTSYRYWRVRLVSADGSGNVPTLAIAAIGQALELPEPISGTFDPIGRRVHGQSNSSELGHPLGRVIEFEEWQKQLRIEYLSWDWLRANWLPAWQAHLRSSPFAFCWDPTNYPDEVRVVTAGDQFMTQHHSGKYASLELDLKGVV